MFKPNQLIRFDWAIKHILRDKANFDVLEGFLSAVLREDVQVLQILESESDRDQEHLKFNRVDILIQDSQGRNLIIEVQNQHESDYLHRMLFGTSRVIVDMLELGQSYREIAKVISIHILYFNLGSGDDYVYYGTTQFVGLHTHQPLKLRKRERKDAGYYLRQVDVTKEIFPEYYLIQVERFEDVVQSPLDEWIYMLKHAEIRDDFSSRNIDQARNKLSVLKMDVAAKRRYERYVMSLVSERDIMETAHREGHAAGRAEGRAEGEHTKALDIARNLLQLGLAVTQITQATGLSATEIDSLASECGTPV